MPQNERSLKRHRRSCVLRNEARRVVGNRTTCRNRSTVCESASRSGHSSATCHILRDWVPVFQRLRVEFDANGAGIDIIEKNLNVKQILLALLLNGGRAESQR